MAAGRCVCACRTGVSLGYSLALLVLAGLAVPAWGQENQVLPYSLVEQSRAELVLGNVAKDAGLEQKHGVDAIPDMQFSFLPQSSPHKDLFRIAANGDLIATDIIDRDQICPNQEECTIKLSVSVQPGKYFAIIEVEVNVEDLNDNIPVFPENPISRSILEASLPGTSISIPEAEDFDSPPYAIKHYNLLSYLDTFDLRVDERPDGTKDLHLVLKTQLDRETIDSYQLDIVAYDGGNPQRTGTLTVNLQVTDVNDNKPVFDESTYEVSILENEAATSTLIQVQAEDLDSGVNGEVVYGFTAKTQQQYGSVFKIDARTGEITLEGRLDYKQSPYSLGVTAKDKHPDSSPVTATVVIQVQDVNDHAPEITLNTPNEDGHYAVSEASKPGDFVAHITVVDTDGGNNGEFNCTINGQIFRLTQMENYKTEFKIVTAVYFDREQQSQYDITFMCQDKGIPAQASIEHITVDITDENDNDPVFRNTTYKAKIPENNLVGAFITQVNATDQDIGPNAKVEYRITDPNMRDLFAIGPQSGNLTAKVRLDYEQVQMIEVEVMAVDHGNPERSATATVVVQVQDFDDEPPKFLQEKYQFTVPEQVASGIRVGQVQARDPDTAPHNSFIYTLDPNFNKENAFAIEPTNGTLYTARMLDRELRKDYHLRVRAVSSGSPLSGITDVFILIDDENDNPPTIDFPSPYNNTVYITQNLPPGHVLAKVLAHDADYGTNAEMRFQIISGNKDGLFAIDELLGDISTTSEVKTSANRMYGLVVMVKDQGDPVRTSEAMLNVVVNKSMIHPMADTAIMPGPNLTIVLTIAGVSGVLMVILLVAIALILYTQRRREAAKKYNYMPRIVDQQIYMSRSNSVAGDKTGGASGYIPTREATRQDGEKMAGGHYNGSYDKGAEMMESNVDYPSMQKNADSPDSVFMTNAELGAAGLYNAANKPVIPGPWNMDPDHHRILYQSDHLVQKPWALPGASLQDMPGAGSGDKDNDSACSADLSNATDSGRGSNDGGSDGHHDYPPASPGWQPDSRDGAMASSPLSTPVKPRPPARVSSIHSHNLPPGVHRTPSNSTQHSENSTAPDPGRRRHHHHPQHQRPHKHQHHAHRDNHHQNPARAPPRDDHVYYANAPSSGPTRSQGVWNLSDNGGGGGKKKYASHV